MDVLAVMFDAAVHVGTLPALPAGLKHRVLLYADNVVVFARPDEELGVIRALLEYFGDASGLHVNYGKSAAAPIRCDEEAVDAISNNLQCPVRNFPCTYLGFDTSPTYL
jgi:hypothetical protein